MNKITKCSICTMVMQALFYSEKCMMNPVDACDSLSGANETASPAVLGNVRLRSPH